MQKIPNENLGTFADMLFVDRDRELKAALAKLASTAAGRDSASLEAARLFHEISDRKLYQATASTITAYGRTLGISKERTSRWVASGSVFFDLLSDRVNGLPMPTNESQLRPLVKLTGAVTRVQAWAKAVAAAGGRVPTAKVVDRAAKGLLSPDAADGGKKEALLLRLDLSDHPELAVYLAEEAEYQGCTMAELALEWIARLGPVPDCPAGELDFTPEQALVASIFSFF